MKKLALITLALVTLQVTAQRNNNDGPRKERGDRGDRFEQFQNLSAEDIATLQTKKMTLELDLNTSQQKSIQKLNLENAKEMKAKMEARKAAKEKGEAKKEKPSQEERVKMMNDILDKKIALKAKMKDILNPEQYEKWEKSQKRMKNGDKERGNRNNRKKQG